MSENAKKLLKRLKKAKKINKQIDIVQELQPYKEEEIVTHVLLVHLEKQDHDALRMEILNCLHTKDETIIKPLSNIITNPNEPIAIKEKAIMTLGETGNKKAMKTLLKVHKKEKDPVLRDYLTLALTHFATKPVIKRLLKALENENLRLQVLRGLARNEQTLLSSKKLLEAVISLEITNQSQLLHFDRILELVTEKYGYESKEAFLQRLNGKELPKRISEYKKSIS